MAINVNIDDQLALEYSFKVAGKKRTLTFTDECALDLEKVQLTVSKAIDDIDNLDEEKFESKDVEDQLKVVDDIYKQIREAIIPFFDKYFGDNAGQEIYKYAHQSTRALSVIFGKINSYLDKVEIKKDKADAYKK